MMTNSKALRVIERVINRGKRRAQRGLHMFGYQLVRVTGCDGPYERILLGARYAPWKEDFSFLENYEKVKSHSLVDIHRCYELWSLVEQSSKLPKGSLIEVGVWRGGTGALIAKKAQLCGIKDKTYLCDTFEGTVKAGPRDSGYKDGEHDDASREIVETLLRGGLQLDNVEILEGVFPDDTAHFVDEEEFRFCHIDVDVYRSARDIVEWIWEKMVVGGIIVYDDYGFGRAVGITQYVEEQKLKDDRLLVYNLNGHGIVIKMK